MELYKKLNNRWHAPKNQDDEGIDIVKIIQLVTNDIEKNGITAPQLTNGWVCPTYKKKDKQEIINYHPITVLNSEYKIITTALMNKLATVAPTLINKCQAAFIKGCSILNQIDLVNRMIDLCEIIDQKGAIIALDQEKAYDRICHDYLWETMRTMNFPDTIIHTIELLYTNAQSVAIVNGEISEKYTIRMGIRQGDPLSCLLFNLAIEPLSAALREHDKLNGLEINILTLTHRVIISLFADDAVVFVSKDDDLNDLHNVLDVWCSASGVKNNKTIVIPVGCTEYRKSIYENKPKHRTHH